MSEEIGEYKMKQQYIAEIIRDISKFAMEGIESSDKIMHDNNDSPYVKIGALEQGIKSTCMKLDILMETIKGK